MTPKQYKSPADYKQALEERIRLAARARNLDMGRFRQILTYVEKAKSFIVAPTYRETRIVSDSIDAISLSNVAL